MAGVTVEQLAKQVGDIPLDKLIQQLQRAGVIVSGSADLVTDEQKEKLLSLLRKDHGEALDPLKKISLKRTSVSEIKIRNSAGKSSTVSVVSKRRRVYVKKEPIELANEQDANKTGLAENQTEFKAPVADVFEAEDTQLIADNSVIGGSASNDAANLAATSQTAATVSTEKDVSNPAVVTEVDTKEAVFGADTKKPKPSVPGKTAGQHQSQDAARRKGKVKAKGDDDFEESKKGSKVKRKLKEIIIEDEGEFSRGRRRGKSKNFKGKFEAKPVLEVSNPHAFAKPTAPAIYEVKIPETITVAELAQKMSIKAAEVIKVMMTMGVMATINQPIDQDTACLVVEEMGHKPVPFQDAPVEQSIHIAYTADVEPRSPIVTVMGHVDHGKTSLLDYIRNSRVTAGEAGGITQHIGAYKVHTSRGDITFIDTPGHESFTAMRARGAHCTDLVILVVAADDGVMPQTVEAIQHAKAANVPIIVAVNKIDKPDADPERVITELAQHNLLPEAWGGDTMFKSVSAKAGTGIDELLDAVMLQAEMLDLRSPHTGPAQGTVIEAYLDKGRGPVATILVDKGCLKCGDMVLAGLEYGRIKIMRGDNGAFITQAGPSVPVEVLGLSGVPKAGDAVQVVADESKAREIASLRQIKQRELRLTRQHASKVKGFMDRIQQGGEAVKHLNIVLKADVHGSLEALVDSLEKISNEEVVVRIIASGVGGFTESDVNLALASDALLVGFNVRANALARKLAVQESIDLNYYSIIYDVINGVTSVLNGKLTPKMSEKIIGTAEVRNVFSSSKWGSIAGCMVIEGAIKRGSPIRVLRDNVVIYSGELESLRRFQESANEVRKGLECGIGVKNYNDIKVNDQIEVFEMVEVSRNVI